MCCNLALYFWVYALQNLWMGPILKSLAKTARDRDCAYLGLVPFHSVVRAIRHTVEDTAKASEMPIRKLDPCACRLLQCSRFSAA